jgi:hypothetical protein
MTGAKTVNPVAMIRQQQNIESFLTFLMKALSEVAFEHPEQSPHRHG